MRDGLIRKRIELKRVDDPFDGYFDVDTRERLQFLVQGPQSDLAIPRSRSKKVGTSQSCNRSDPAGRGDRVF